MKTKKLFDLPIPQSGCGDTQFQSDGTTATLRFEFRSHGKDFVGAIQFQGVIAYRYRDELHSVGYPSGAYESIAEVDGSEWCKELKYAGKHIAVFLSSNGIFEVLAESVSLEQSIEGSIGNL
jgi:hypothetical protein